MECRLYKTCPHVEEDCTPDNNVTVQGCIHRRGAPDLANRCNDCIFRLQFEQVGADGNTINICAGVSDEADPDGGYGLYEISTFDADKCLNYIKRI